MTPEVYAEPTIPRTGGSGFIESNLVNHLAADNDIVALDNGHLGTPKNHSVAVEYVDAAVLGEALADGRRLSPRRALVAVVLEENPTVIVEGWLGWG